MTYPFQNPELPLSERVDDLVSRLSLPEKINQLLHENNAVERLGVPAYNWWSEACHGVGRNGRATIFPQVIGMAATWNRPLLEKAAQCISDEARAKHHAAAAMGRRGQYQGLTFWTPNINIFRDPRWGRGQETFGEDPFLTGELGLAIVKGLQGEHPRYLKTAACAKHFAVHSGPEDERHSFDARPSPKDLNETYLPAFEKLVRGGVETVMGAYNRVLGEPACGSRFLITETLREKWNFQGHVVSDCGAIDDFHQHHKVTQNAAESAALAVRNGCDLNCGCTYNDLLLAVRQGLISEAEIDTALRRLLNTKFKLGLFDPEAQVPYASIPSSVIDCPEHRQLARQVAVESIVLLKNKDQILPLRDDPASMLVVGPNGANATVLLGNYYGVGSHLVTLLEGIVERTDPRTRIKFRVGTPLYSQTAPGVNYTFPAAESSEVVIAILGLDPSLEGEEGDTVASPTGGDRPAVELPENQRVFLRELRQHCKKLILVLTGGSALAIPEEHELCDAIIQVWYPGCEGGRAVAEVLFGDQSPSGKMPVTVPKATTDLPPFNDYRMAGRTYRFSDKEALYPFGFGLSYARFTYTQPRLSCATLERGSDILVSAQLSNESEREADETVQCYVVPPRMLPETPKASLVAFRKVRVPAKTRVEVSFHLRETSFLLFDREGEKVWFPGDYEIVIGSCSPGPRASTLGAPAPVSAPVKLV